MVEDCLESRGVNKEPEPPGAVCGVRYEECGSVDDGGDDNEDETAQSDGSWSEEWPIVVFVDPPATGVG